MGKSALGRLYGAGHRLKQDYVRQILGLEGEQAEKVGRISGGVHPNESELISQVAAEVDAQVSLEIGLGYGFSAVAICAAAKTERVSRRHIICDPHQSRYWDNGGLSNLASAGLLDMVEFHEEPSHRLLPKLEAAGERVDFAFVDGWHTFDAVLVDLFYIDKLLRPDGVVMFDDADWPSVRDVLRYAVSNLGYEIHSQLTDHDGRPSHRDSFGLEGSCIALRKPATPRDRNIFFHERFLEK